MKRQIMLDIETLGVTPGSAILSIAAVDFDREKIGRHFYRNIQPESNRLAGLTVDPATVTWWDEQAPGAREALNRNQVPIEQALEELNNFIAIDRRCEVWGNGADFDKPLLDAAYRACGMRAAWPTFSGRCYRTMKSQSPEFEMEWEGCHHNALDDAINQARYLQLIWKG
jgi:hypothetical protein